MGIYANLWLRERVETHEDLIFQGSHLAFLQMLHRLHLEKRHNFPSTQHLEVVVRRCIGPAAASAMDVDTSRRRHMGRDWINKPQTAVKLGGYPLIVINHGFNLSGVNTNVVKTITNYPFGNGKHTTYLQFMIVLACFNHMEWLSNWEGTTKKYTWRSSTLINQGFHSSGVDIRGQIWIDRVEGTSMYQPRLEKGSLQTAFDSTHSPVISCYIPYCSILLFYDVIKCGRLENPQLNGGFFAAHLFLELSRRILNIDVLFPLIG